MPYRLYTYSLVQWLSRYRRVSIKTMRAQGLWFEARPDPTLSPGSGQKWGARGSSGRLASAKLVIHVKYGIFIYALVCGILELCLK